MKMRLIYPKWRKLEGQTPFTLPPHGPVVFAASLPPEVEVAFTDENVDPIDFDERPDLVGVSIMLTAQLERGKAIIRRFKALGIPVICGGISTTLHAEELTGLADSVFVGEAEGHINAVIEDFKAGRLQKVYNLLGAYPDITQVGTARRDILNRPKYAYRGVPMVDLVHASRGCRFNCFPCCVGYLGGRNFRPRPIAKVVEELQAIPNNRLFVVDNSLSQNTRWEEELFTAMIPLKKKWVCHPIEENDKLLDLAYKAGAWYVYQAVFDTSEKIRQRIRRYKDHGIGVEGTIILGTDDQDADFIKRLVDFLLELDLDLAEFTIMTPFQHTPIRQKLERDGRLLEGKTWDDYTCDRVVFKPAKMSPDELQKMFYYAWDTFYKHKSQEERMGDLFRRLILREMADGTYRRTVRAEGRRARRKGPLAPGATAA
jgi:radical SAM superfamily enzyme YgiQ (UPF0313 family)